MYTQAHVAPNLALHLTSRRLSQGTLLVRLGLFLNPPKHYRRENIKRTFFKIETQPSQTARLAGVLSQHQKAAGSTHVWEAAAMFLSL